MVGGLERVVRSVRWGVGWEGLVTGYFAFWRVDGVGREL